MSRVKNLKTQRAGGESAKLLGEIQEIKGMLKEEKRAPQDVNKITEISVIVPKET